jgi:hypothetical protein
VCHDKYAGVRHGHTERSATRAEDSTEQDALEHKEGSRWTNCQYKATLVARGDQQTEDLSFEELFATTTASASFRALCAVAAMKGH